MEENEGSTQSHPSCPLDLQASPTASNSNRKGEYPHEFIIKYNLIIHYKRTEPNFATKRRKKVIDIPLYWKSHRIGDKILPWRIPRWTLSFSEILYKCST